MRKEKRGILFSRLAEVVKRYNEREEGIIYAHMFEKNVWWWEKEREIEANNYMLTGELIHQALPHVLEPAPTVCRKVVIPLGYHNIDKKIWQKYVRYDRDNRRFYVKVCGSADAMLGEHPVELKTTRNRNGDIKEEWLLRSRIYAWLYSKPTILVVLNLVDAVEENVKVGGFTDHEMQDLVLQWLRGDFPHRSSALFAAKSNYAKRGSAGDSRHRFSTHGYSRRWGVRGGNK